MADGVGMCKYSDEASSIAVKSFCKMVHAGFPFGGSDEDIMALINLDMGDYETTLAVALYDGKNVYYGNVRDSGIIALDEYGEYHVLSEK